MSVQPALSGDRIWTPTDLDDIVTDEDWRRYEIVDGVLVVSPPALPRHEVLVSSVGSVLRRFVPDGFKVAASIGIVIGSSYRITDVAVVTAGFLDSGRSRARGHDVVLAVEIESPTSLTTDRVTKPAQYAAAGVAHYWRIETDPLRLVAHDLSAGVYVETGSWVCGETAHIRGPLDAVLDTAELLDC